ncbi:MAG TPA: arginine deiminase-related protein [Chthoniobacterales bacterium]
MTKQSANAVMMVRPSRFFPNPETASDNTFQRRIAAAEYNRVGTDAREEFDRAVDSLSAAGVHVHVIDDTPSPPKPDAVFPNNWFSTHHDGRVVLYPMHAPSRRAERRADLIGKLRGNYRVIEVVDYTFFEGRGLALEGTGSLVLDHLARIAYVSLSNRTDVEPLHKFCADFSYEPITFTSSDADGQPIYHTNVMMCLGTEFALIGLETIDDLAQRAKIRKCLEASKRTVIELSREQIANFAGNALELHNEKNRLLVLSARAEAILSDEQRTTLARFAQLLPLSLPTIELAGGSARCMLASIHLPQR